MTRSLTFNHRECRPHELAGLRSLAVSSCKKESRGQAHSRIREPWRTAFDSAVPRIDNIYGLLVLVPLPALAVTEQ